MAVEIERKFLLTYLPVDQVSSSTPICQGYMIKEKDQVVRIRLAGETAFLTIKGPSVNTARKEYEYPIPLEDAREMIELFCKDAVVEKTRYSVEYKGFEWVIDQFSGINDGLLVAEIELESIDQAFELPDWIGEEVTHDPRYYNSNLIDHPYASWQSE